MGADHNWWAPDARGWTEALRRLNQVLARGFWAAALRRLAEARRRGFKPKSGRGSCKRLASDVQMLGECDGDGNAADGWEMMMMMGVQQREPHGLAEASAQT